MTDGSRKLVSFQELTGMEGNIISLQEICSFEQTGLDDRGKVKGHFKFQGIRPRFMDKFKVHGIQISGDRFSPTQTVGV
jgi:pilus assembly protein CpaF